MADPIVIVSCDRSVLAAFSRPLPPGVTPDRDDIIPVRGLTVARRTRELVSVPRGFLRVSVAGGLQADADLLDDPQAFGTPAAPAAPVEVFSIPRDTAHRLRINGAPASNMIRIRTWQQPATPLGADQLRLFVRASDGTEYDWLAPPSNPVQGTFDVGVSMSGSSWSFVALYPGYIPFLWP